MNIPPHTAFNGKLSVHYGQAYVLSPGCDMLSPEDAFTNQINGLCGAAVPGGLFLVTGLHTGQVTLRIQVHQLAPPVDETWDEIVETGWRLESGPAVLEDWDANKVCEIPLEAGSYRVRYSACRFGEATEEYDEDEDEDDHDREPVESYLLEFWPASHEDDAVLKQTSEHAAYWNAGAWETMRR